MKALPNIQELSNNTDEYDDLEEILLFHPAVDLKFLKSIRTKVNKDTVWSLFNKFKKQGKLKPQSYELIEMLKKI